MGCRHCCTLNSFVYYGFGYAAINMHENGELFLGLFTVFNAVLHFAACYLIYKRQDATRDTFYLVAGMVLVFLTLAVPVQLDGQWVTIIWALEGHSSLLDRTHEKDSRSTKNISYAHGGAHVLQSYARLAGVLRLRRLPRQW